MTLALLLTAVGGAWADEATITLKCGTTEKTYENVTLPWSTTANILKEVVTDLNFNVNINTISGGDGKVVKYGNENFTVNGTFSGDATVTVTYNTGSSATITVTAPAPLIALDDTKTVATMAAMPAYDATVSYELVRDMASKVDVQVLFNNEETTRLRIAKDGNGKYQLLGGWKFIAYDNIDAQNPVSLDGQVIYTFKKKNAEGGYDAVDTYNNGYSTGTWRLEAEGQETSSYAGIAYGKDITLYEANNLTLVTNPETINKVSITVDGTAVTPQEGGRIPEVEVGKSVKLSTGEGYLISNMFTGYKVSFTPAEGFAWSKVGCYYWGNYGNNNIFNPVEWPGVEMTKNDNNWETIINVSGTLTNIIFNDFQTNNKQTNDLPFASGAADDYGTYKIADVAEVTYNTTKTEATFTMPAYDIGLNFNVKRDMSVKMTAEMAKHIRIKETGDTFSPIEMTDVQPTVTDQIDAQKPIVLEYGKDYSVTMQKKGEGDQWTTTQDYSVGTFRIMVTGAGEYSGTIYTNEFELYTGYEVTVAPGEYATLYVKEAVVLDETNTDAEIYTISNVTDSEAQLSEAIKVAPKETPLLVYNKSEQDKTFLLIPTAATADEVSVAKEFRGTLVEKEMPASSATVDYYVCTGSAFMWVRDAGVIAANRCWLQIGEQPAASRTRTRSITGGSDTTGINAVDSEQWTDDSYYDLQGRKVTQPNRKGIYIKNGQKVILR